MAHDHIKPPFTGKDDAVMQDIIFNFARSLYALCGGREADPRRSQKVSCIQIAIRDGSEGTLDLLQTVPGGAGAIVAERRRQIAIEGLTAANDDRYTGGELILAASCYLGRGEWPKTWLINWFKPKDRRSNLVRAGALIAAEIDRLDRAAIKSTPGSDGINRGIS